MSLASRDLSETKGSTWNQFAGSYSFSGRGKMFGYAMGVYEKGAASSACGRHHVLGDFENCVLRAEVFAAAIDRVNEFFRNL